MVEVISSSLIIPKPNVSFSILTCSPAVIEWELRMDKRLVGLTWGGKEGYISGSELQANMKRMDTSYALEWKTITNPLALSTNKEAISNATMNLTESSILAQDER